MPKADRLEHARRVETVRQLILSGKRPANIVPLVADQWQIKPRMARNYVRQARQEIDEIMEVQRTYRMAEHIAIRMDIRQRARGAKDFRAELAAAVDEAKLFGLYPAERVEIEHGWRQDAQAAGLDADALVEELFAKVKADAGDDPA